MKRETRIKIIGTGTFLLLFLGIIYLVYHSNKIEPKASINSIVVSGNNLLNKNDYLSFTRLLDLKTKNYLSLSFIKSRFEKHPYVQRADVKFSNEGEVSVYLTEKNIFGVVIKNGNALLMAENFEILPVFQNTKMVDVPILSNVYAAAEMKPLEKFYNEDLLQAYRIIKASELTNAKMIRDLAEINLRNGGDVVLTFSGFNIPVIFGRTNESRKMVSLEALINNYLVENDGSNYIDLRFYNDIYIGYSQRVEL